jgi:hypothetical protein
MKSSCYFVFSHSVLLCLSLYSINLHNSPRTRSILVLVLSTAEPSSTLLIWAELYVTTDGQPASLSWNKPLIWGLWPDLYYVCDSYGLVLVGRPLWRQDGSVFYICCWPLPAQSFFGPSPLGLATIFYWVLSLSASGLVLYSHDTHNAENTVLFWVAQTTQKTSHVIAISPVYWRADCCLATTYKHSSHCCVRLSRGVYQFVAWQCVDTSQYISYLALYEDAIDLKNLWERTLRFMKRSVFNMRAYRIGFTYMFWSLLAIIWKHSQQYEEILHMYDAQRFS